MHLKKAFFLIIFLFVSISFNAQSTMKSFFKLSCPEKWWVIGHPFVAKKVQKISNYSVFVSDSLKKDTILDGDPAGGQIDAFRHAFWMCLLTQNIGWRRAKKLGKAHEKGNYKDFKKHRKEEGILPDKISSDMDIANNDVGIQLGMDYPHVSRDSVKQIIIEKIKAGELLIIFKDEHGNYLNCDSTIIDITQYLGKWEIPKCLVSSKNNRH